MTGRSVPEWIGKTPDSKVPDRVRLREALAAWMIRNSYATGHGDTHADLLGELDGQHAERMTMLRGAADHRAALTEIALRGRIDTLSDAAFRSAAIIIADAALGDTASPGSGQGPREATPDREVGPGSTS